MDTAVIDRPACACAHGYRPPRLGDLLHARLGDGTEHSTMLERVSDDGRSVVFTGPVGRDDLVVTIRRVGDTATPGAPC